MFAAGRYCCKSLFASLSTNFPGRGCGSRKTVWGLHHCELNSQATLVTLLREHRPTITACSVLWREICRASFWDFCNAIPSLADISQFSVEVNLGPEPDVECFHHSGYEFMSPRPSSTAVRPAITRPPTPGRLRRSKPASRPHQPGRT